mgnify:FL=1
MYYTKTMKTLYLIADGAQDAATEMPTSFSRARTPHYDALARIGEQFEFCTVPDGMEVNSDVAFLKILGIDPKKYYTGRAPLEAAGCGIPLKKEEFALRLNFVFTQNDVLQDFGIIFSEAEKAEIFAELNKTLPASWRLFPEHGYRNLLLVPNTISLPQLPAPQNYSGKTVSDCFPQHPLTDWMRCANRVLKNAPVNLRRKQRGLPQGNGVWLWGGGSLPNLPNFYERTHRTGAVVTAVDVVKGIARLCGMDVFTDASFTGDLNTNFTKKAEFALQALSSHDVVLLHVEAPDECSHRLDRAGKIAAIEKIDTMLGDLWQGVLPDTEIFVLADHRTGVESGKHERGPVTVLKCVKHP